MRRTKEQAAITRQRIAKAADDLFVEHGFDGVSLDQIAAAAGVKRGAVHFHFVNKPGVLLSILAEEHLPLQLLADRLDDERKKPLLDDLLQVLVEMLRSFEGDKRRRALLRAMMTVGLREEAESRTLFVEFEERMHKLTFDVLAAVAKRGQLAKPWTTRSAATAVHSCCAGLLLRLVTSESESRVLTDGAQLFRVLIRSFSGAEPKKRG